MRITVEMTRESRNVVQRLSEAPRLYGGWRLLIDRVELEESGGCFCCNCCCRSCNKVGKFRECVANACYPVQRSRGLLDYKFVKDPASEDWWCEVKSAFVLRCMTD